MNFLHAEYPITENGFIYFIECSEKPPVSLEAKGSRKRKRPFHGLSAPLSPSNETSLTRYSEGSITKKIRK